MSVDIGRRAERPFVPVRLIPMNSKRKKVKQSKRKSGSDNGNTRIVFLLKVRLNAIHFKLYIYNT